MIFIEVLVRAAQNDRRGRSDPALVDDDEFHAQAALVQPLLQKPRILSLGGRFAQTQDAVVAAVFEREAVPMLPQGGHRESGEPHSRFEEEDGQRQSEENEERLLRARRRADHEPRVPKKYVPSRNRTWIACLEGKSSIH